MPQRCTGCIPFCLSSSLSVMSVLLQPLQLLLQRPFWLLIASWVLNYVYSKKRYPPLPLLLSSPPLSSSLLLSLLSSSLLLSLSSSPSPPLPLLLSLSSYPSPLLILSPLLLSLSSSLPSPPPLFFSLPLFFCSMFHFFIFSSPIQVEGLFKTTTVTNKDDTSQDGKRKRKIQKKQHAVLAKLQSLVKSLLEEQSKKD